MGAKGNGDGWQQLEVVEARVGARVALLGCKRCLVGSVDTDSESLPEHWR